MPKKKKPSGRHIGHLGFTIPAFAEELEVPEGAVRRAVDKGRSRPCGSEAYAEFRRARSKRLRGLFKIASPA